MAALVTSVGWLRHKLRQKLSPFPREVCLHKVQVSHGGCAKPPVLVSALHTQQPNHCLLQICNHLKAFTASYIS